MDDDAGGNITTRGNLNGIDVEDYLLDCVRIEPLAIQEEFVRCPRDLAYWNERYAHAYEEQVTSKLDLERVEGMTRIRIEAQHADAKKKVTVPTVDALVLNDDDVYNAKVRHIKAEVEVVRIKGVLDAVRAKRDMIVSIGAHIRAELAGDPTIRAIARDSRAIADQRNR